jgi:hypothetical protein
VRKILHLDLPFSMLYRNSGNRQPPKAEQPIFQKKGLSGFNVRLPRRLSSRPGRHRSSFESLFRGNKDEMRH